MPFSTDFKLVKRFCLRCNVLLKLKSNRDLERKRYCSHSCRQKHRCENGQRPTGVGRPKGCNQVYKRVIVCELCPSQIKGAHPTQRWCVECVPDQAWAGRARRYGVGKKQWDVMLAGQGGSCALCAAQPEVVDHDHVTGDTRGLLCGSCNLKLAAVDDREWLLKALEYARRV